MTERFQINDKCPECGGIWNKRSFVKSNDGTPFEDGLSIGDEIECYGCGFVFRLVEDGLKKIGALSEPPPSY